MEIKQPLRLISNGQMDSAILSANGVPNETETADVLADAESVLLDLEGELDRDASDPTAWTELDRSLLNDSIWFPPLIQPFDAVDLGDFYRAFRNRWITSIEWNRNSFYIGNINHEHWSDRIKYLTKILKFHRFDENSPLHHQRKENPNSPGNIVYWIMFPLQG